METVSLVFDSVAACSAWTDDARDRGLQVVRESVFTIGPDGRGFWEERRVTVGVGSPGHRVLVEALVGPLFL